MLDLWKQLGHYLRLHADISLASSDSAKVVFTALNRAPALPTEPLIVFRDVVLTVTTGEREEAFQTDSLGPGGSTVFEFHCKPDELPFVEHAIIGRVDADEFFRVPGQQAVLQLESGLPKEVYLRSIDQALTRIDALAERAAKSLSAASGAASPEGKRQTSEEAWEELNAIVTRTRRILGWIGSSDRARLSFLIDMVDEYVDLVGKSLARLVDGSARSDPMEMQIALKRLVRELPARARAIRRQRGDLAS